VARIRATRPANDAPGGPAVTPVGDRPCECGVGPGAAHGHGRSVLSGSAASVSSWYDGRAVRLADVLSIERIRTDLSTEDKDDTLRALARMFSADDRVLDEESVYRAFHERERMASTGVGSGIAIPHGRLDIDGVKVVLAISPHGIPFDSIDGELTHIFVALLGPRANPADQLRMLARVSRVLRDAAVRQRLLGAGSSADVLRIVLEEEQRH